MWEMISDHWYIAGFAVLLLLWLTFWFFFEIREEAEVERSGGEYVHPRELQLGKHMEIAPYTGTRADMVNRFMPKPHNPERSAVMADQILRDQQRAHEDPGEITHAPAPGEPGYEAPTAMVRVSVGQYTVNLQRGFITSISEATMNGAETPPYPISGEWEPVIAALAFEVKRLREGWSVTA